MSSVPPELDFQFLPGENNSSVAAKFSVLFNTVIIPIDGGFRIKETEHHYIDVMRMILNWRITQTRKDNPLMYDGGWDYFGTGVQVLLRTIMCAVEWDDEIGTSPMGWDKDVITGEYGPESGLVNYGQGQERSTTTSAAGDTGDGIRDTAAHPGNA